LETAVSLLEPDPNPAIEARLGRWFLVGGLCGAIIGLLLFIPGLFNMLGDAVFFLFPSSIMGLAEPKTTKDIAFLLSMEFTSQFVLYGSIGFAVGTCVYFVRKLSARGVA
jgi:uncharacterized RDD family membrane protein YckC